MPRKSSLANGRVFVPEISEEEAQKLDALCKKLIDRNADADTALLKGMERGHYTVQFLHRMMANHAADGKAAAVKYSDVPAMLDLLYLAGLDLRFDDDALAVKAVDEGQWKTLDYLVHFHAVPATVRNGALFTKAIESRDRETFLVLLSALKDSEVAIWDHIGQSLVNSGWWQGLTDLNRNHKRHFRRLLANSDLFKIAASAGAGYLSLCAIRTLATEQVPTFPEFTEEEAKTSKGFLPFFVGQLQGVWAAQVKHQQAVDEEEEQQLSTLKPSAINTQKSDF